MYNSIKLTVLVVCLMLSENALAQEFDYEYHRSIADSIAKMSFMNSPEVNQQEFELMIRDEKIKREKLGWLSSFKMGVQFLSVNQDYDAGITKVGVLPTLGVSLQLDFERFFTTPSRIRSARHESSIIKLERERLIKVHESEIISFYYDYVLLTEQTNARFLTLQTIKEQAKLIEEKFRNGETTLDEYLNSVNAVDNAVEAFYETKIASEKKLALLENKLGITIGVER